MGAAQRNDVAKKDVNKSIVDVFMCVSFRINYVGSAKLSIEMWYLFYKFKLTRFPCLVKPRFKGAVYT